MAHINLWIAISNKVVRWVTIRESEWFLSGNPRNRWRQKLKQSERERKVDGKRFVFHWNSMRHLIHEKLSFVAIDTRTFVFSTFFALHNFGKYYVSYGMESLKFLSPRRKFNYFLRNFSKSNFITLNVNVISSTISVQYLVQFIPFYPLFRLFHLFSSWMTKVQF